MSQPVSFTWVVHDPVRLPSILTGLALRVTQFSVMDMRPALPAWHIEIRDVSPELVHEIMQKVGVDPAEDLFPT